MNEETQRQAPREIIERCVGHPGHDHHRGCPTWNGYPEFTPAHCPGGKRT